MGYSSETFQLPPEFQCFNQRGAFRNYERNLPHWRQPGATYFLTFRLHDSLPAAVLEDHKRELEQWRQRMAHERSVADGDLSVTTTEDYEAFLIRSGRLMEATMDEGHGSCVLKDPKVRSIVAGALLHFQGERHLTHGLVVMPNHVHLAVQPLGEWQAEDLLRSWKGYSAREINKLLGGAGQLWQHDSWNRIIRDAAHWHRVMRYIVGNPARARCLNDESTVWVDARLRLEESVMRESLDEEPW